jgi:thiamine pyrophosphate-dependent acetolactate synthase large subunit-like protein
VNRTEAVRIVLDRLDDGDVALFATGMISREAFAARDRDLNLYLIGSMGLVASVGFGVALQTRRKVFVFDGDGSVLMDLGALANAGALRLPNLFHLVLDNEAYQSTGGQPTVSSPLRLDRVAAGLGYARIHYITSPEELARQAERFRAREGPVLAQVKVPDPVGDAPPRVDLTPAQLACRFAQALKE